MADTALDTLEDLKPFHTVEVVVITCSNAFVHARESESVVLSEAFVVAAIDFEDIEDLQVEHAKIEAGDNYLAYENYYIAAGLCKDVVG